VKIKEKEMGQAKKRGSQAVLRVIKVENKTLKSKILMCAFERKQ
jgi:hypothetical protein